MKRYMPECNYEEDGLESYTLTECAQGPVCKWKDVKEALVVESRLYLDTKLELDETIKRLDKCSSTLVVAEARNVELTEFVSMCAEEKNGFESNREISLNWAKQADKLLIKDSEKDKEIMELKERASNLESSPMSEEAIDILRSELRVSNEALITAQVRLSELYNALESGISQDRFDALNGPYDKK